MSRPVLPLLLLIFLLCGGPIFVRGLALVAPSLSKIDRRKSPALWRLLQYEEDDALLTKSAASAVQRQKRSTKPEIMAPAGGWPQLRAAVANGADAVYLGLSAFSARARATNFDESNLYEAVAFAHRHHVKVYVAMNTLIFDREFTTIARWVTICQAAGVDALIVQDLGLAQFIRRIAPNMHIHASTQQTITDAAGVLFCHNALNTSRVVLGRELSTVEIAAIIDRIDDTNDDDNHNDNDNHGQSSTTPEIEVFVHGALCVSYSGQCFSSEAWGGRSANRGQCAQACRLPYELIVNGALYHNEPRRGNNNDNDLKYVLSPQDLCGLDQVPALIRAGVACFKIEGRLKDAEYVAATTRAYRNAVDIEWQRLHPEEKQNDSMASEEHMVHRQELVQLFSRGQDETHDGLTTGFLDGTHHQRLVRGRSPRHRGVHVGRVDIGTSLPRGRIVVTVDGDNATALKLGDGICIDRGLAQEQELGGSIFAIQDLGDNRLAIQLGRSETQMWQDHEANRRRRRGNDPDDNEDEERELVPVGAHVWKTHDAVVERKFRKLSELSPPRRHAVKIRVDGAIGRPLTITMADDFGSVAAKSSNFLVASEKGTGMDGDKIRKAIGTLGNTDYYISNGSVDLSCLEETAWCPISWIKDTRRAAVELWEAHIKERDEAAQQQQQLLQKSLSTDLTYQELQSHINVLIAAGEPVDEKELEEAVAKTASTTLSILCREYSQVAAICDALDSGDDDMRSVVGEIVVDFLEVDGMRAAVDRIHQSGITSIVASPRILKPGEGGIWRSLLSLQPGGLLIRSTGLLHQLQSMGGTKAIRRLFSQCRQCFDCIGSIEQRPGAHHGII
jgi:U32 family peptidase